MDCHRLLRARASAIRWSIASVTGIWLGTAGCTHLKQETVPPEPPPVITAKVEKNQPRRLPQASTCVACGDLRMHFASEPSCTAVDQERLHDEAARAYQQAIKIDAGCVSAYLGLARIYQKLEEYDKAVATLQSGVQACPKEPKLWFELGMCHARRKEWDSALANLRNATELDPDNHYYANVVGFCLARAGQFDESYQYFAKAQGEAKAHYNVARMLHHVEREAECKKHLELALKSNADFAPARQFLAEIENPSASQTIKTVSHEESIDEAARKLTDGNKGGAKEENDWE